nr:hypothetical protein [Bacillus sp. TL12]
MLLFVVICSNLLFTPLLRMLDVSQMYSIWIVTSISASIMLTIVISFIDGTYSSKVQLIARFVFFLVGCIFITYMIVF